MLHLINNTPNDYSDAAPYNLIYNPVTVAHNMLHLINNTLNDYSDDSFLEPYLLPTS